MLGADGCSVNGGRAEWKLPTKTRPGFWMPKIERLQMCRAGYHLVDANGVRDWVNGASGKRVFVAEWRGAVDADDDCGISGNKVAVSQARLVGELFLSSRQVEQQVGGILRWVLKRLRQSDLIPSVRQQLGDVMRTAPYTDSQYDAVATYLGMLYEGRQGGSIAYELTERVGHFFGSAAKCLQAGKSTGDILSAIARLEVEALNLIYRELLDDDDMEDIYERAGRRWRAFEKAVGMGPLLSRLGRTIMGEHEIWKFRQSSKRANRAAARKNGK